jgi:hypothetical protein
MALITLMVFNALIMAISLSQPNSPHSINETPGLQSIKETPGLLLSISTQRHTTFRGAEIISLNTHLSAQHNQETLRLLLQTKGSHLTLGFLHRRSAKQSLPTASAAPQPPGHGNIFFCSIISWTLFCIPRGSSNTLYTDLTVGVPLAGTPPVSRTSRSSSDSLSRRSNRLSVAPAYHKIINCRNHPLQFGAHRGAPAIHHLN